MGNDEKELVLRLSAAIARLKEITSAPPHVYAIPGALDRLSVKRDTVLMAQFRLAEAASTIERLSAIEQERPAIIGGQSLQHIAELAAKLAALPIGQSVVVTSEFHEVAMVLAALLHEGQG